MKKLLSALLALSMIGGLSVSSFAAIGVDAGTMDASAIHGKNMVHYVDGTALSGSGSNPAEGKLYRDFFARYKFGQDVESSCMGVVNVKVGETVTLHTRQNNFGLSQDPNDIRSYYGKLSDFQNKNGKFVDGTTPDPKGIGKLTSAHLTDTGCLPLDLTGLQNGTAVFIVSQNPFSPGYVKVVVGTGVDTIGGSPDAAADKPADKKPATPATPTTPATPAPATPDPAVIGGGAIHTVKLNDTFGTMALNYYGDMTCWPAIFSVNADAIAAAPNGQLYEGMELVIPPVVLHKDVRVNAISAAVAGSGEKLYTVQANDTYGTIAQAHFGDASRYKEIFNRNSDRLKDLSTLFAGQIIVLP